MFSAGVGVVFFKLLESESGFQKCWSRSRFFKIAGVGVGSQSRFFKTAGVGILKNLPTPQPWRGGGVGLVHLEVNSDPQYNGALSVPMRLPRLPSHNNRAEKSFQLFKLSDNRPKMGRRHRAPGSTVKKSF